MRPTSLIRVPMLGAILFMSCAIGHAQTTSTVKQASKTSNRQADSFVTAQQPLAQKADQAGAAKQRPVNQKAIPKKGVDEKPPPQIPKQRRTELMGFVKTHHPELRPLLNSLQKKRPVQFQAAMRTLDREVRNLQSLKMRSQARYTKAIEQWIIKSNIKLLSAQLVLKKTDKEKSALKNKLKMLITKHHDLRVVQLTADITQTKKRLQILEEQSKNLRSNRDNEIQLQLYAITRNAKRILANQKKAAEARKKQAKKAKPRAGAGNKKPKKQDDKTNPTDN